MAELSVRPSNDSANMKILDNLELHQIEGYVVVSVNPKLYPLDLVYSACYVLLDKAYVFLNSKADETILVSLRYKEGSGNIEHLGRDFNNELIKFAVLKLHTAESKGIRDSIVNRALATNSCDTDDLDDSGDNYLDDLLGIAKPWKETHKNE